jgi:hypothetical protein
MHAHDSLSASLETRIASLERANRRTRLLASALAAGLLLVATAAFTPRARALLESVQAQEEVATQRLVLQDAAGEPAIVLLAGPESSLVVVTPDGSEVVRLGGPPARPIGH